MEFTSTNANKSLRKILFLIPIFFLIILMINFETRNDISNYRQSSGNLIKQSESFSITINQPENITYNSTTSLPLNVEFNGTVNTSWYSINGGAPIFFDQNTTFSVGGDGLYEIIIFCNDSINEISQSTPIFFTVDTTPPNMSVHSPTNTTYNSGDFTRYPLGSFFATESFEDYSENEMPNGFSRVYNQSAWCVEDQYDNHNKALHFWTNASNGIEAGIAYIFRNETGSYKRGTFEFWLKIEHTDFLEVESFFQLLFWRDGLIYACDWNSTPNYQSTGIYWTNNTWYHIRIDFDGHHTDIYDCRISYYINQSLIAQNKIPISSVAQTYTFHGENSDILLDAFGFYKVEHYEFYPPETFIFTGYLDENYSLGLNLFDQSMIPINFTTNEDCSWLAYSLDGNENVTLQGNASLPLPAFGLHWIELFAMDKANNTATSGRIYFTLEDTSPPICNISRPLDQVYTSRFNIPLNLSFNEATSWVGYSINGSANTTFTGNTSFSVGSDGSFILEVYANDTFGNLGITTRSFAVDTKAPIIQFINPSNGSTFNTTIVELNVTIMDLYLDSAWYAINSSGNITFSGNESINIPSDGWWEISVWANDTTGHESNASSVFILVDTTSPYVNITTPSNHSSFTTSMVFFQVEVVDNNLDSTWYVLDGSQPVMYPSNTSLNITDGSHEIQFFANDTAGNLNSSLKLYFIIDTLDPIVNIFSPENGGKYSNLIIDLNVTVDDVNLDSTWYNMNNSANVTFDGNESITMPGEGWWQINVWANDTFGRESIMESVVILVDTIPPNITIISPANHSSFIISDIPFTIEVMDVNLDSIWYIVDGGLPVLFPVNNSIIFSDGSHEIEFQANDTTGNVNSSDILSITIDTLDPIVSIISPVDGGNYSSKDIQLNVTALDANLDSIWYNINGTINITFNGSDIISFPSDGTWQINVWANDTFGRGSIMESVVILVDTIFPIISIASPANHSNFTINNINFTVIAIDDNLNEIWYKIDGGSSVPFLTNSSIMFFDGLHQVEFFANDTAGNENSTGNLSITIDTHDPMVVIISPIPESNFSSTEIVVNTSIFDENIDMIWYTINGSNNTTFSGNGTISVPTEGYWTITVHANDTFSRIGQDSVNINVSFSIPIINVISLLNNTKHDSDVAVSLNISCQSTYQSWIIINGNISSPIFFVGENTSIPFSELLEGNNSVEFFLNDSFGHLVSTGEFTIEKISWGKVIKSLTLYSFFYSEWNMTVDIISNVSGVLLVNDASMGLEEIVIEKNGILLIGPVIINFNPDESEYNLDVNLTFNVPSTDINYYIARYDGSAKEFMLLESMQQGNQLFLNLNKLSTFCVVYLPVDPLRKWYPFIIIIVIAGSLVGVISIVKLVRHKKKLKQKTTGDLPQLDFGNI